MKADFRQAHRRLDLYVGLRWMHRTDLQRLVMIALVGAKTTLSACAASTRISAGRAAAYGGAHRYFVYILRVADGGGSGLGGAGASETVSQVFQPCGRFCASNSP